jgi:hypothetical protein
MSIAHELSCDIAAAMLAEPAAASRAEEARADLTDIVLEVHTTLRRLTRESQAARTVSPSAAVEAKTVQTAAGAGPGGR